jgi:hypothetical protein
MPWEKKKIIKLFLMWELWNFFGRGKVSLTHSEHSVALFRVKGETPGHFSRNNVAKNYLSASAIAIMSWQNVTRSSLCSGVEECGTKCAYNFLLPYFSFRIRWTTGLWTVKDVAILLNAIRRSFLTKSATAVKFTSVRVDFGPSNFSSYTSSFPSRNREFYLLQF